MKFYKNSLWLLLAIAVFSCEPYVEEKTELGPPPTPSFDIVQNGTPNDFLLINTTEGGFITHWDLGVYGRFTGEEVAVNIPFKGTYDVIMTTFNQGGSGSLTQQITVTEDDPNACFGNMLLLTNCAEKVWKLAPEANAMHIGPNLNDTWWGNSLGDVSDRDCHFDDEYIFRVNGEFEYDNKGNFWADSDENGNVWPSDLGISVGCHANDAWPTAYESWGSGVHAFSVTESTLTVSGLGAWIGLYKIGTTEEVTEPQTSITYNIQELTANRMVLFADYGWGVWRITLVSN